MTNDICWHDEFNCGVNVVNYVVNIWGISRLMLFARVERKVQKKSRTFEDSVVLTYLLEALFY